MSRARAVQIPGDSDTAVAEDVRVQEGEDGAELPASRAKGDILNDAGRDSPETIAAERERVIQAKAIAEMIAAGQVPSAEQLAALTASVSTIAAAQGPIRRKRVINGVEVDVEIPSVRRNDHVVLFGAESQLPGGTPVNKDGTAFDGTGEAYGVIGNIKLPEGVLVNRIIPLRDEA